jgi:type I restriction enzyme, S subunit
MQKLVTDWVACSVNDLFQITGGGTPSTKVREYWNGDIPWITSADIQGLETITSRKNITIDAIQNSAANIVPENSIIVVTRVGLGKIALSKRKISFSQDCQGLVAYKQLILPKYALYYLSKTVEIFKFENRGTTISGVTKRQLKELPFLLPPLPEQHCIVEKIEELFSELDNGVQSLKKAREQLKIYRQAVLKHAFEGKLTRKWREQQIQADNPPEPAEKLLGRIKKERETQYLKQVESWQRACEQVKKDGSKKPAKPKKPKDLPPLTEKELAELPELPEGWRWVTHGNISEVNPRLPYFLLSDEQYVSFLPMSSVKAVSGQINLSEERRFHEVKKGYTAFIDNDVIFAKITPCMENGKAALVKGLTNGIGFGSTEFHVARSTSLTNPKFIFYYITQEIFRKEAKRNMKGTAGQLRVPTNYFEEFKIPLPALPEQNIIVQEIETRLSVCDQLEQTIEDSLKKAEALRQSILKKAFEGELTKEWRKTHPELISGENSAESLLARIRAEKTRLTGEGKKRRSGKRQ